jgi:hydrogenase maturation protease
LSGSDPLIIGIGNLDRGDDAAGLLVARRLRAAGFHAIEHTGDGASLIEAWSGAERVILVDAVVSHSPAGTIFSWDGRSAPVLGNVFRRSTHDFGVGEAIQLGRVLARLPQSLTVYGIEGRCFEPGAEASPEVLEAVERLAQQLQV